MTRDDLADYAAARAIAVGECEQRGLPRETLTEAVQSLVTELTRWRSDWAELAGEVRKTHREGDCRCIVTVNGDVTDVEDMCDVCYAAEVHK